MRVDAQSTDIEGCSVTDPVGVIAAGAALRVNATLMDPEQFLGECIALPSNE